jgi:hypothetical protein
MPSRYERERLEREQLLQRGQALQDDIQEEWLEAEELCTTVAYLSEAHRDLLNEATEALLGLNSCDVADLETLREDHLRERIRYLEEHQAYMVERNREFGDLHKSLGESNRFLTNRLNFLEVARDVHFRHRTPVRARSVQRAFHFDGAFPHEVNATWYGRLRPRGNNNIPYARDREMR